MIMRDSGRRAYLISLSFSLTEKTDKASKTIQTSGKLYWKTWAFVIWAMVPTQSLVFEELVSLEKINIWGESWSSQTWHKMWSGCYIGEGNFLHISVGPRCQGKEEAGGDFLEMGGFGPCRFKSSHSSSSCYYVLCYIFFCHPSAFIKDLVLIHTYCGELRCVPCFVRHPGEEQSMAQNWSGCWGSAVREDGGQ